MQAKVQRFGMMVAGWIVLAVGLAQYGGSAGAQTLTKVRERGYVLCGTASTPGINDLDERGIWRGFHADFCRAVAAAVVGDGDAVEFRAMAGDAALKGLAQGEMDLSSSGMTVTLSREARDGLVFAAITYFDGAGLMAMKDRSIRSLSDVKSGVVCVQRGTTTEAIIREYVTVHAPTLTVLDVAPPSAVPVLTRRQCDFYASDRMALTGYLRSVGNPDAQHILPGTLSREPLGIMVRAGDPAWESIVRWTVFALILAEEKGLTAANLDSFGTSSDPEIRRLAGGEPGFGQSLGLTDDWTARAIRAVGNYGEIYARTFGAGSEESPDRGLNRLWSEGGLMYAPPLR